MCPDTSVTHVTGLDLGGCHDLRDSPHPRRPPDAPRRPSDIMTSQPAVNTMSRILCLPGRRSRRHTRHRLPATRRGAWGKSLRSTLRSVGVALSGHFEEARSCPAAAPGARGSWAIVVLPVSVGPNIEHQNITTLALSSTKPGTNASIRAGGASSLAITRVTTLWCTCRCQQSSPGPAGRPALAR